MASINFLQHHDTRSLQFRGTGHLERNEFSGRRWNRQSRSFQCGERSDILLDGHFVLFFKCNSPLHRDQGRPHFWDVSIMTALPFDIY
jgi:hypothetical protein